jgi:hypothetical protein
MLNTSEGTLPFFKTSEITFVNGKFYDITAHKVTDDASYSCVKLNVAPFRGGRITGQTSTAPNSRYGIGFTDKYDAFISGYKSTNTGHYEYAYDLTVPDDATYIIFSNGSSQTVDIPYSGGEVRYYPTSERNSSGHYKVNIW